MDPEAARVIVAAARGRLAAIQVFARKASVRAYGRRRLALKSQRNAEVLVYLATKVHSDNQNRRPLARPAVR